MIQRRNIYKTRRKEYYPFFSEEDIDAFECSIKNEEWKEKYEKLKNGINFITGRKLKENSKVLSYLKLHLRLIGYDNFLMFNRIIKLEKAYLDKEIYLNKRREHINKIDQENIEIDKKNKLIEKINKQILNLKSWNEFIRFEDIKYGLPEIKDGVHLEKECKGILVEFTREETKECRSCRNGYSCNFSSLTGTPFEPGSSYSCGETYIISYWVCNKCNKTYNNLNI